MRGCEPKIILYSILAAVLLIAVRTDLRSRRIPNALTLPAALLALALHTLTSGVAGATEPAGLAGAANGLFWSLGGLASGLGLMLPAYLAGFMGAGDVKLMAVAGAFMGPWGGFTAFLFTCLAGGLQSLVHLATGWLTDGSEDSAMAGPGRARAAAVAFAATGDMACLTAGIHQNKILPYGLAIAAGTFGAMAWDLAGQPFIRVF